jgi:hypothetical protein
MTLQSTAVLERFQQAVEALSTIEDHGPEDQALIREEYWSARQAISNHIASIERLAKAKVDTKMQIVS